MRIGILTYHRSNNYGAFLQSYALSRRLKQEFPSCEIRVIDYLSEEVFLQYHPTFWRYVRLVLKARPFRRKLTYAHHFISFLKTRKYSSTVEDSSFEEARKQLPLTEGTIITDKRKRIAQFVNKGFDIIIVGSDAVWNWQIRRFPNIYFLGPEVKTKKLSYAASSYGQLFLDSKKWQKRFIRSAWSTYDYIGVRDCATEDFVHWIDPDLEPVHNCDPTVILDMESLPVNKTTLREKLEKAGVDFSRKRIAIMAKPWLANYVRKELGDEYQIVSVFVRNRAADVNLLDLNPFEWALVFSFFDITITHYFHGNLLSLRNGTPTITIEQKNAYNQQYCSKIIDFMRRIHLEDNCFFFQDLNSSFSLKSQIESILSDSRYGERLAAGILSEQQSFQSFKNKLADIVQDTVV